MWQYTNSDELYHYGVPGMRWGHRKPKSYVNAKKNFKQARKEYAKAVRRGWGIEGIKKANQAEKKYNKADMDFTSEKIKYKVSKAKNKTKAEFKAYTKEVGKSGLPGSAMDRQYNDRSTRMYNTIVKKKGKKYADKVVKRVQNRAVATLVGSAVVAVGATVAQAILISRS